MKISTTNLGRAINAEVMSNQIKTNWMMSLFSFCYKELEAQLQRFHDTEAKLQEPKDLEEHDGEKSKRIAGKS